MIRLYTGLAGSIDVVQAEWFDHNNTRHLVEVRFIIPAKDKPRALEVEVLGAVDTVRWIMDGRDRAGHSVECRGCSELR